MRVGEVSKINKNAKKKPAKKKEDVSKSSIDYRTGKERKEREKRDELENPEAS